MKAMNVKKHVEGFITNEERCIGQRKADALLRRVKAKETKDKTTFTGRVNGKFTQLTIKGERAEERFKELCLAKSWDFSNFTKD